MRVCPMPDRNRFVWKLNAIVFVVVSLALVVSAVLERSLSRHFSLSPRQPADLVLIFLVAVSLCALALRSLFQRLLRRPIDRLTAGTRRVGSGDLDFRFDSKRRDELGELEESFDFMAQKVQEHQAELLNALEYLQGIIESSADIIITVSPDHLIERFNTGAEEALGYRREEVQGQRIEMLFARQAERKIALDLLADSDNVRNFRTDFKTKQGEIRNVLLTLSRLRDSAGEPIGTFGISKDITEERKLISQVIEMKKLAAIGEAVTGIQHAVKNMLNALKGGAYVLRSGLRHTNRERMVEGLAMLEEGIERMSNLSTSLLNYAREWRLAVEDVDIAELVGKVRDVVKASATARGISLKVEELGASAIIRCDPRLIHMVVMDLVTNSIDACLWKDYSESESPEIVLRTSADQKQELFSIEVNDNGCGMSKEVMENLFKPFFSTKDSYGTGIGLSLTERVVERHGGSIEVQSELGSGTSIRVVLPFKRPAKAKESAHEESSGHR